MKKPLLKRYLILFGVDFIVGIFFSIVLFWIEKVNDLGMATIGLFSLIFLFLFSIFHGTFSYYKTKSVVFPALTFLCGFALTMLILHLGDVSHLLGDFSRYTSSVMETLCIIGMWGVMFSILSSIITKIVLLCIKKSKSHTEKKFD